MYMVYINVYDICCNHYFLLLERNASCLNIYIFELGKKKYKNLNKVLLLFLLRSEFQKIVDHFPLKQKNKIKLEYAVFSYYT